ncbi:MAG: DUF2877 domain-containing protein [Bdellovibrionales bacterium]|nr:DUF2877 domain-containing protein [Bdellovibrionales bacterium]MBT3526808.1 DUF2877 domain-containing protein [Bdellovibrionales bacterium]
MAMELLSYGDSLPCGQYYKQSTFEQVINFAPTDGGGDYLASIVTATVGDGPLHVMVDHLPDSSQWDWLRVDKNSFVVVSDLEVIVLNKGQGDCYHSQLDWPEVELNSTTMLEQRIKLLTTWLALGSQPGGIASLLHSRWRPAMDSFNRAFYQQLQEGIDYLFSEEWSKGAKMLKGIGPGLTPAGDDFLLGVASASYLMGWAMGREFLSQRGAEIACLVRSNNLVVDSMAGMVAQGRFTYPVKSLLTELLNHKSTPEQLKSAYNLVNNFGQSSGSDFLSGLVLGIERSEQWLSMA